MTVKFIFVLIICLCYMYMAKEVFRQERGFIKYANPKYVTDVALFTGRSRRSDSYKTNITGTNLHPWGNNISFEFSYGLKGRAKDIEFKSRLCESLKTQWISVFVKMFSDIKIQCPYPPKTYSFYNIEVPPKHFPFPLPKGDTVIEFSFFLTKTREMILDMLGTIRVM